MGEFDEDEGHVLFIFASTNLYTFNNNNNHNNNTSNFFSIKGGGKKKKKTLQKQVLSANDNVLMP